MRVLILPDSFKGTLAAQEAAAAMADGVREVFPDAELLSFPMADGGEGSSAIAGVGAERIEKEVCGPEGSSVRGFYYLQLETAFIELAAASGFSLSTNPKETAARATTFGTGELIADAISRGARHIRLFLGGSATSDAGVGFAKALAATFFDAEGRLIPSAASEPDQGEQLAAIASFSLSALRERLAGVDVLAAVDVTNPLFGPNGAAAVYGPQKGLNPAEVEALDRAMAQLAALAARTLGQDHSLSAGAGAAGGAGFGVLAFLGGRLQPGAAFFLDAIGFDALLQTSDLILTGEGRADSQSVQGKLVGEIAARTKSFKGAVCCICGAIDFPPEQPPAAAAHLRFYALDRADALSAPKSSLRRKTAQILRNFC